MAEIPGFTNSFGLNQVLDIVFLESRSDKIVAKLSLQSRCGVPTVFAACLNTVYVMCWRRGGTLAHRITAAKLSAGWRSYSLALEPNAHVRYTERPHVLDSGTSLGSSIMQKKIMSCSLPPLQQPSFSISHRWSISTSCSTTWKVFELNGVSYRIGVHAETERHIRLSDLLDSLDRWNKCKLVPKSFLNSSESDKK